MKIKSLIITAVTITAIFSFSFSANAQIDAQALIAQLQSQIQVLLQQIQQMQSQQAANASTPTAWCHTFNINLGVGSKDDLLARSTASYEVMNLTTAMQQEGLPLLHAGTGLPDTFNEITASIVIQFQKKYGILQTGFVGPLTRAKLNQIYGCKTISGDCPVYSPPAPGWCTAGTVVSGGFNSVGCPNPEVCIGSNDCPNCLPQCKTTADCPQIDAVSPQGFSLNFPIVQCISGKCVTSTTQPSITVISPNGGEGLHIGQPFEIKWSSQGITSAKSFVIYLERKGPGDTQFWNIATIAQSLPQNGSYTWTPNLQTIDADYKIMVSEMGASGLEKFDESDRPFYIGS
jgi:type II secretory pathway pseudopilin PulG